MPTATTSGNVTETFDLKTLPGGYVTIRRMTYGEYLKRQQMTMNMKMERNQDSDTMGTMELINKFATEFEFGSCIVDHNLEDEAGKKLNFKKEGEIDRLDPRIGNEINARLNEMNNFEEAEQGNSDSASDSQS